MTATVTNVARPSERRQFAALRALFSQIAAISHATQAHFAKVMDAHVLQAQFSSLSDEVVADVGMSAEEILSAPTYSEELPFFMQSAHGKRG